MVHHDATALSSTHHGHRDHLLQRVEGRFSPVLQPPVIQQDHAEVAAAKGDRGGADILPPNASSGGDHH